MFIHYVIQVPHPIALKGILGTFSTFRVCAYLYDLARGEN